MSATATAKQDTSIRAGGFDKMIIDLWHSGLDTDQIARQITISVGVTYSPAYQARVANRLAIIRDAAHHATPRSHAGAAQ